MENSNYRKPFLVTAGSKGFELQSGDMFGKILIMELVTKGNENALTCLQLLVKVK